MIVAAEPMLLDTARPIRNGIGSKPARSRARASTGVKAKQMMSLAYIADNRALDAMTAKRNRRGRSRRRVSREAEQV